MRYAARSLKAGAEVPYGHDDNYSDELRQVLKGVAPKVKRESSVPASRRPVHRALRDVTKEVRDRLHRAPKPHFLLPESARPAAAAIPLHGS